jgi:hypothetical protein
MGSLCGISEAGEALGSEITAAKAAVDGLVADQTKGIAASIGSLKASLDSITSGIGDKLNAMAPELPVPLANLQDKVTSLMNAVQSPGGFLEELADIKLKFPTLNIDDIMAKVGIDPKQAQAANDKLESLKAEGQALMASIPNLQSSINNPFLYKLLPDSVKAALGDKTAIDSVLGKGIPLTLPGINISDKLAGVCVLVPNKEIQSDGKEVEKGTPTKAPIVDAVPVVEVPAAKAAEIVPEVQAPNESLKESPDIEVIEMSEERSKIQQKGHTRRVKFIEAFVGLNQNPLLKKISDAEKRRKPLSKSQQDQIHAEIAEWWRAAQDVTLGYTISMLLELEAAGLYANAETQNWRSREISREEWELRFPTPEIRAHALKYIRNQIIVEPA